VNITNLIIFVIVFAVIAILAYATIAFGIKNKKLSVELLQERLDRVAITSKLNQEIESRQSASIEKSDGFIKFLSDSRDWAFSYIESVQESLAEFERVVGPTLKYHKTYGQVLGPTVQTEQLDKIVLAYEELQKLMPENTNNPDTTVQDKEK
jgi:hypothetical protein